MEDPIRGLAEAWEAEVNDVEKERDYWREEARQTRILLEAVHRRIDELPQWEKNLFVHFNLGGEILRVPMPYGWGQVFGAVPEEVVNGIYKNDPEGAGKAIVEALGQALPINPALSGENKLARTFGGMVPALVKPAATSTSEFLALSKKLASYLIDQWPTPVTQEWLDMLGRINEVEGDRASDSEGNRGGEGTDHGAAERLGS